MQQKTLLGFEREMQFKVPIMFFKSRSALVAIFAKLNITSYSALVQGPANTLYPMYIYAYMGVCIQTHSNHLQQIGTAALTFSVELKLHSSFVGAHLRCR